jgi:putative addiction module killer protein
MEARPRRIELFTDGDGHQPFVEWLLGLKDKDGKAAIQDRLDRLERGNFGDCARYGAVTELRVHVGPGYRVYLGEDGPVLVILLGGSNKARQTKGFKDANRHWQEYIRSKP